MIRTAIKIKPMPWNDERIETLRTLWADGLSCSQIARAIGGVSRNAVIGKVHRLGLAGRAVANRDSGERQRSYTKRTSTIGPFASLPISQLTEIRDLANEPVALTLADGQHFGTLEIGKGQCRWPHGDVKTSGVHYCAHPVKEGSPYCQHHKSRAWDHKATARSAQKAKDASYENEHRRVAA